jgi:hypothetical protein
VRIECELLNEIVATVSIITDLYAAPDPRYSTGFEGSTMSRRAVTAALLAHLSSLSAFLPVLSCPRPVAAIADLSIAEAVLTPVYHGK